MVPLDQSKTSFQNINAVCAFSLGHSLRPLPALQCPGSTSWLLGLSWNNEDELMTHHDPPLHLAYTSGQSSPHQLLPPLTTPTAVYLNRHSITDNFGILSSTATNTQGEAPPILFELQGSAWISVSMSSAHSAQVEIPAKLYLVDNLKPLKIIL